MRSSRPKLRALKVMTLGLLCLPLQGFGCWVAGDATKVTFEAPLNAANAPTPDPSVLLDNNTFYSYTTTWGFLGVPVTSTTNVGGTWNFEGNALNSVGTWVKAGQPFWAPDVIKKGNTYYLYYSAFVDSQYGGLSKEHAIGVACSSSPVGPFDACDYSPGGVDQPVYRDPWKRGVIDAEVVPHGSDYYLLWSLDWGEDGFGSSVVRKIQGCKLTSAMNRCATGTFVDEILKTSGAWEQGVVENPTMVLGHEGNFILFYSGGFYKDNYKTGHAWCGTTPLMSCLKDPNPIFDDNTWPGVQNPGGLDMISLGALGTAFGVFHAAPDNGVRKTHYTVFHYETH